MPSNQAFPERVLDYTTEPKEAWWRTPLAFVLALPLGLLGSSFIWLPGTTGLWAVGVFAVIATGGLCRTTTRKRVIAGLVMCLFLGASLAGQSMWIDSMIHSPFDGERYARVFAIGFGITSALSLCVSVPFSLVLNRRSGN